MIHGGFWRARVRPQAVARRCARTSRRAAGRRGTSSTAGSGDGGGYPRTLDDVAAAVDHLAEVPAHRPGVLDLARVVAIGHSAGGHLAAWLATREAARVPVTGVVAQAGVLDLRMASALALSDGVVHELLGGTPEEQPERYAPRRPPSGSRSASRRC